MDKFLVMGKKTKIGFFQLATGAGKTTIISEFIKHHSTEKFLIFVPRLLLLYQTHKHLNSQHIKHIILGTNENDKPKKVLEDARVIICVYNSVHIILNMHFNYVLVDEAHHIFIPDIYRIFQKPQRTTRKTDYIELIQTRVQCDYMLCFSATFNQANLAYNYPLGSAIQDGAILDYRFHVLFFENVKDKYKKQFYDNNIQGKKILVLCNSIEGCIKTSMFLNCDYIEGNMTQDERVIIMKKFETEQRYLISCRTLSEGANFPFIDTVVFLDERNGQVDIIQSIGRAQRTKEGKSGPINVYLLAPTKNFVISELIQLKLKKYFHILYEYDQKFFTKFTMCYFAFGKCGLSGEVKKNMHAFALWMDEYLNVPSYPQKRQLVEYVEDDK